MVTNTAAEADSSPESSSPAATSAGELVQPRTEDPSTTVPPGVRLPVSAEESVSPAEFEAARALPQALKIVASVAAPTTILTALLFYFGLLYAVGYYRYFGVNYTVLELSVQDYLVLSADGAIIPVAVLASATLFALWIYQLPLQDLRGTPRRIALRIGMPVITVTGVVLIVWAVADAVGGATLFPENLWEARGLSLTVGILLVAYGARLRRLLRPGRSQAHNHVLPDAILIAKWAATSILVSIGLFWAVGSYGIGVGAGAAQGLANALRCQPDVILYSEKDLNLDIPGVEKKVAGSDIAAYGFRYSGLKLIPQSGSHYLLLSHEWARIKSPAILLMRSDPVRLEFVSATGTPSAPC